MNDFRLGLGNTLLQTPMGGPYTPRMILFVTVTKVGDGLAYTVPAI
jgi:hypothetical protein